VKSCIKVALHRSSNFRFSFIQEKIALARGAGATGATAPVAQTMQGQHGGNRLPFFPELQFEIRALFTGIGIFNYS
jgi:hypothetical protein